MSSNLLGRERSERHGFKRFRNRFSLFLVTLFGIVGITTGLMPSSASATWDDCTYSNRVCTWLGTGGTGSMYYYTNIGPCITIGGQYTVAISSVWNRYFDYNARFYINDTVCNGAVNPYYTFGPGEKKDMPWLYDNNTSLLRIFHV
jgi:hypothetical protein